MVARRRTGAVGAEHYPNDFRRKPHESAVKVHGMKIIGNRSRYAERTKRLGDADHRRAKRSACSAGTHPSCVAASLPDPADSELRATRPAGNRSARGRMCLREYAGYGAVIPPSRHAAPVGSGHAGEKRRAEALQQTAAQCDGTAISDPSALTVSTQVPRQPRTGKSVAGITGPREVRHGFCWRQSF